MLVKRALALICTISLLAAAMGAGEKEVPYVPTPTSVVDAMLEMAEVRKTDTVYDLGCGDGRIVISAAKKYGAKGFGVDIDPERIRESEENARAAGVADRVDFAVKNLYDIDLAQVDVVTLYLLPSVNMKLRPKLFKELRPGARVVSHAFDMGDWKPDAHRVVDGRNVYLWIMPSDVSGRWQTSLRIDGQMRDATLDLKQEHQQVTGTARAGERELALREVQLVGDKLQFVIDETPERFTRYSGQVVGAEIQGIIVGAADKWSARRGR
jgi:SAM-dependent methyltransferase